MLDLALKDVFIRIPTKDFFTMEFEVFVNENCYEFAPEFPKYVNWLLIKP